MRSSGNGRRYRRSRGGFARVDDAFRQRLIKAGVARVNETPSTDLVLLGAQVLPFTLVNAYRSTLAVRELVDDVSDATWTTDQAMTFLSSSDALLKAIQMSYDTTPPPDDRGPGGHHPYT